MLSLNDPVSYINKESVIKINLIFFRKAFVQKYSHILIWIFVKPNLPSQEWVLSDIEIFSDQSTVCLEKTKMHLIFFVPKRTV